MLFKYLLASVALMASVLGSATDYSQASKVGVKFDTCASSIEKIKEPVVSYCKKESVEEVKAKLNVVYQPVAELAAQFHALVEVDEKIVVKYSKPFVTILTNFQVILQVVARYPKIVSGCHAAFSQFDSHFDSLASDFKNGGIDVHELISQHSALQLSTWATFGFKFQTKYGFSTGYNSNDH